MTIAEIEELIRKYLSTGIAVVVVLVAPGTRIDDKALPPGSQVVTVAPARPGPAPTARPAPAPDSGSGDRTGAGGSDPGADDASAAAEGDTGGRVSGSGPDGGSGSDQQPGSDQTSGSADGSDDRPGSGSNAGGSSSSTSDGTTAAATLGWGAPNREDDFSSGAGQWSIYDGAGHGGQGRRSPSAVSTAGGVLTITGDSAGTTAGMAWNPGQRYGRWEGRVRAPASDPSYNALLLLWPDAEDWPSGGEIDFMEMSDPSRQETNMFLHYGADNQQRSGTVQVDATQWHNWAVEWTPDAITTYVDGKEWYRTTDRSTFPPGPMHLAIQLDWFPQGGSVRESTMQVDWVRQYPLDATGSSAGGSTGTRGGGTGDGGSPAGRQSGPQPAGDSADDSDGGDRSSGVRNLLRRMFSWG